MKKQIIHLSIHQTSKVVAAMHTAMVTGLFILRVLVSGSVSHGTDYVNFSPFILMGFHVHWLYYCVLVL